MILPKDKTVLKHNMQNGMMFTWILVMLLCFLSTDCKSELKQVVPGLTANDSDPGVQLVQKYYRQRRGQGRLVPDTLDLQDNALLAIHAITSGMDPELEHRLWFSIYFDRRPMCMRHHQLSEFDQAGKYLEGIRLMRLMTGSKMNLDREAKLWEFLDNHTKDDGLIYYNMKNPGEPPVYAYTQARALLARICRYLLEPNDDLKTGIEKTIDSLVERKLVRGFGFGTLLPAVRWYELTAYPNALKLAQLEFEQMEKLFVEDGSFGGHFHYHSGAAIGLLAYGLMTKEKALVQNVCRVYEFARSEGTNYGYFPETVEPASWVMRISNEGCCTADMASLAAVLCQSGAGDYWDDLDRYLRNQLTEMQMKRTDFMDRIPEVNKVAILIKTERGEAEVDDWTRFIGTFAGWAAPNDFAGPAHFWIQQCCLGNAPRGLYQGWESIVTKTEQGYRVNLLLNRSTPELEIDSYLPYEGKVEIQVKKETSLAVRIPGWADLSQVTARVDSETFESIWKGRYLELGNMKAGKKVTLAFPVTQRYVKYRIPGAPWTSKYSIVDEQSGSGMPLPRSVGATSPDIVAKILEPVEYTAHYRGNTIVGMDPEGTIYPLYQRKTMLDDTAPKQKVDRYIPEKLLSNWK